MTCELTTRIPTSETETQAQEGQPPDRVTQLRGGEAEVSEQTQALRCCLTLPDPHISVANPLF